jgi:pilin isopeptide linkage protein
LSENTKLTNKAVLTDNDTLPTGGVTATGTSTIPSSKLIDKSMVGRDIPTYVEYALNVNPDGSNLLPGTDDTLQIVDIMGSGMTLSTTHSNCFKVYDVTNVSQLLDSDGNVIVANAQTGEDITDECSYVNITGQSVEGMAEDEVGKPTYLITIPDGMHVAIVYWATFEGAEDESVEVTNRASFFYKNKMQSGSNDQTSDQVVASAASSSLFVGPFFYLQKTDQWGQLVPDVTYSLYEVTMDSSGNITDKTKIMTKTTGSEDTLYFGHRTSDSASVPQLYKNRLYCLVEESAPAGYAIASDPYYFEFKEKGSDIVNHPEATELHQFVTGGTYSFTNQFTPASYSVPVKKLINGKNISSDVQFSFNLIQASDDANVAYTDSDCTVAIPSKGITATINGSGNTLFDNLYFDKVGAYTFTLTENSLSTEAENNGYTRDSTIYTITVVVDCGDDNELYVKNASFVSSKSPSTTTEIGTEVPTFDNGVALSGKITLNATKVVTNRAKAVQAGEFAFTVSVGGKVISEKNDDGTTKVDEDGKPVKKLFYTEDGGNIKFDIDINQDDIGTQTYVISEVTGDDPTIKYTTDRVRVRVTIAEVGNGKVEATNYEYLTDAVFTNEYKATGSVTLEGTKVLENVNTGKSTSMYKGEFNFIVKEGDTQVATGSNEANGSITFSTITYDASDIGVHTYYISEKNEALQNIEYTTDTVQAIVTVTDAGDGKLATSVQYVGNLDSNGHALFTNKTTQVFVPIIPTGISLDILPYVLLAGVAVIGVGVLIVRIRKRKS